MPSARYRYRPAILWVLASTALWTGIFAAGKFAAGGIGVFQITFLRLVGAFAVALLLAQRQGGLSTFASRRPGAHFLRALSGVGAAVLMTWASSRMPLADATALGIGYGVLLVLLGAVFLGERPTRRQLGASAVALSGAAVVVAGQGAMQTGLPLGPALAAIGAAFLFAVEGLLIRILGLVAFGEWPGPATLAGSALILAGGVLLARGPRR